MAVQAKEVSSKADRTAGVGSPAMPQPVRLAVVVLLATVVAGALYLLAVRGDALLADLAAIAALICG